MINSIYDAKILRVYNSDKLKTEIARHNIYQPFTQMETPAGRHVSKVRVVLPSDEYDTLPIFTQPIQVALGSSNKDVTWVVDGRPFMRQGTPPVMTAKNDWSFQCLRMLLQLAYDDDVIHPVRLGTLPGKVFIRWITQSLSLRFNLDLSTQMTVSVLCGFYYYQLLSKTSLEMENFETYASHVSTLTGVPQVRVLEILQEAGKIHTIDQLLECFHRVTQNSRLKGFNFTALFMVVSTSWIGVHSRENVGLALEHAPTLLALIYMACDEKAFRKTIISRHAENAGRLQDTQAFVKHISRVVGDYYND